MLPAILSLLSLGGDEPPVPPFVLNPPTTVGTQWVYETKSREDVSERTFEYGALRWTIGEAGTAAEVIAKLPDGVEPTAGVGLDWEPSEDASPPPLAGYPAEVPPDAATVEAGGVTYEVLERDRLTVVPAGRFRCVVLQSKRDDGATVIEHRLAPGVGLVEQETRRLVGDRPVLIAGTELHAFDAAPSPPLTEEEIAALPKELFPTDIGTTWTYGTTDTYGDEPEESRLTVTVVREGTYKGNPAWMSKSTPSTGGLLEGVAQRLAGLSEPPTFSWETYDPRQSVYLMDASEDASRHKDSSVLDGDRYSFAFWPPRVGLTFTSDGLTETVTAVSRETVVVPAGSFDCIRVETEYGSGGRSVGRVAVGVGFVLLESFNEAGEIEFLEQLLSFTPGKK